MITRNRLMNRREWIVSTLIAAALATIATASADPKVTIQGTVSDLDSRSVFIHSESGFFEVPTAKFGSRDLKPGQGLRIHLKASEAHRFARTPAALAKTRKSQQRNK